MVGGELVLGPFIGRAACIRIPVGQGVCGTAVSDGKTQLVEDVHAFPGHIACDAASRSELVVPIMRGGVVTAVIDLDSPDLARFDAEERNCSRHESKQPRLTAQFGTLARETLVSGAGQW